jgi:ferredoxin-NADP reductase
MNQHVVKIKSVEHITHDVLQIVTEKPQQYNFTPGQATEVAINKIDWLNEKRPFTFTSLPNNDYLEFTIKTYPSHEGVTNELIKLKKDEELILHEVFGAISYKGEGVFIAGGAGVTPFISIFRYLQINNEIGNNKLIFANKTKEDIILAQEFENLLDKNFINILSNEKVNGYAYGQITEDFLKPHIKSSIKNVYVCGPPPMMEAIEKQLQNLNVDEKHIIKEEF